MKITITKEHINNGKIRSPWACPIALAAKDALDMESVSVGNITINSIDKTYYMPEEAVRFIRRFDVSLPVEPFAFEATENPYEN